MDKLSRISQAFVFNKSNGICLMTAIVVCLATLLLGLKALYLTCLALIFFLAIPFVYQRSDILLYLAMFAYPLTRVFSSDEKIIITALLYTVSLPCALCLFRKYFSEISSKIYFIIPLIFYMGITFLSILNLNSSLVEVMKESGRSFYAIFIILAIYDVIKTKKITLDDLSLKLSYFMNLVATIALFQYATKTGGIFAEGFYRARGVFFNFNEYGYIISVFISFALYFLFTSQSVKQKSYWIFTIALNIAGLITTMSKTSMVATALIFMMMSLFLPWKKKLQLFGSFLMLGLVVLLSLKVSGMFDIIYARFFDNTSLTWRFNMWQTMGDMIAQSNILIGEGANASRNFLQYITGIDESYAPHNIYLETLYNYGILGLIPFCLIFMSVFFKGLNVLFNNFGEPKNKVIGLSIMVISIITIIQNFVSNAFYDRAVNIIFWAILTLFLCWYSQNIRVQKEKSL